MGRNEDEKMEKVKEESNKRREGNFFNRIEKEGIKNKKQREEKYECFVRENRRKEMESWSFYVELRRK